MYKLNIYILFFPFISIFVSSLIFLFFQIFLKKKYFINLIISFIFFLFVNIFLIYKFYSNFSDREIFYTIFVYLCNSFIFINLIQMCVSSVRLTILKIIYSNPGITKKNILIKYNPSHLFDQRIVRLKSGGIISQKGSNLFIKNKRILLVLNFFLIMKKIFNIKN